jgi:hypothetical protein
MGGGPSIMQNSGLDDLASRNTPENRATTQQGFDQFNQQTRSASDDIPILSVFHPFPLRLDTQGNGTKIQYDACFQIGEFPSEDPSSKVQGTKIVILVPLKSDPTPGEGAIFINAVSRHIPTILAAQADPLTGYPDTPAATGADWNIAQIVKTDRSYYTWVTGNGTRVIVMAEPILVSEGDITNILRLPVTPPEDVIHEIGDVRYKPAPPIDSKGNPVPCKSRISVPQMVPGPTAVAMTKMNKPAVSGTDWLAIILGILGSVAVLIGVWFGLKAAMGPGGDLLKRLGDALGKSIAGGYGALKKARSGTAGVLGIGPGGPLPARRVTRRNPPGGLTIRTPAQVADTAAPVGTPAAMGNISPVNIPEPKGDFTIVNPAYSALSRKDYTDRLKTRRNRPSAEETLRRQRAESYRLSNPAGTGLFDLRNNTGSIDDIAKREPQSTPNTPGLIDDIAQRKPTPRKSSVISEPVESNVERIARLAKAKKAVTPVKRRKIMVESEDEAETPSLARTASIANRLKRASTRAKESVGDFDRAVETTPTSDPADPTRIFGSRAMRQRYGIEGGKRKRKNRLKTGRKV